MDLKIILIVVYKKLQIDLINIKFNLKMKQIKNLINYKKKLMNLINNYLILK